MNAVKVSRKGADRWASGHPWIFASDVIDRGNASRGEAVRVLDQRGRFLGVAHYSSSSQICLRLLSPRAEAIDAAFWRRRIANADLLRQPLAQGTDSYRMIFGEADLLPGLVVDRYADHLVMQTLDQGMDAAKDTIGGVLNDLFQPAAIVLRNDTAVRKLEELPQEVRAIAGTPQERVPVRLNGLRFEVAPMSGQKTGIYLDQRENYLAAASHARGRALDCFTSTGGFGLHMAARCESVLGVDSSATAVESSRRNAEMNSIGNVEFREANAFDYLAAEPEKFSTIVLDPPAFAKSRSAVESAARGYKEINVRALRMLKPGGVLVTCSCSHHMSEAMLLEIVAGAALDARRTLRVLERRTQAADHPILLTVPETHYLKCLILQAVDDGV